jgi:cytochrome oxidase Cu insertion factor (SCO1/SenC/PrrC family)
MKNLSELLTATLVLPIVVAGSLVAGVRNPTVRDGTVRNLALARARAFNAAAPATAASRIAPTPQETKAPLKAESYYTCPMHPEIKSAKRGKCPKCQMALRLVKSGHVADTGSASDKETMAEQKPAQAAPAANSTRKMVIPDIVVLDQDGKAVHFYSDLVKDKTVVINFIFTTCTTICPPLAATFARVQQGMGDKVGRDVHFISISVDPLTDTPERLKAWGAKFKAGAGWTFVTGDKQEMDKLLNALGASVARREDHTPTVLVGNDAKDIWTRTYGLARTSQMVGLIMNVMEGKTGEAVKAGEAVKEGPKR